MLKLKLTLKQKLKLSEMKMWLVCVKCYMILTHALIQNAMRCYAKRQTKKIKNT